MTLYATKQGDVLTVYNLVSVKKEIDLIPNKNKYRTRGKIKHFSKESKRRLRKTLFKLKKQNMLFVTLTYAENMEDGKRAKSDLDNFCRKVSRRNKKMWFVWKMEYQERGAIHFHLLVGGVSYKYLRKILNAYWHRGFYHVKIARKIDLYYFSKYISKDGKKKEKYDGRFWGIYNKEAIAFSKLEMYNLSKELEGFFITIFKKKKIENINSSITLYTFQ